MRQRHERSRYAILERSESYLKSATFTIIMSG